MGWWRVFGLALGMMVVLTACNNSDSNKNNDQTQSGQSDGDQGSSEQHPAPDIVQAHAPEAETKILDAKTAFDADIGAPNDIVRDEIQKKKSTAWRNAVLEIGDFANWTAYVSSIDSDGRIELRLSQTLVLKVWADVSRGGSLFSTIRTLREGQPVYISGRIAATNVDAMKASDDDNFPTCFEDGLGLVGCEIDLQNIAPL